MKYKLKANEENFDVVDGPFAGKKFRRGKVYRKEDIPKNEMHRFESIDPASPGGSAAASRAKSKGHRAKSMEPKPALADGKNDKGK